MSSSVSSVSRWLNKIVFGASVRRDETFEAQWSTIITACALNTLLALAVSMPAVASANFFVASAWSVSLHDFWTSIAIANLLSLLVTYVASITWDVSDQIRIMIRMRPRSGIYLSLAFSVVLVAVTTIIAVVLFITPDVWVLLCAISIDAFCLLSLLLMRAARTGRGEPA